LEGGVEIFTRSEAMKPISQTENLQPLSLGGTKGDKSTWTRNCKTRAKIIAELLGTEETYLRTLKELKDEFLTPFTDNLKNYIDLNDFRQNIETLISLHGSILEALRSGRSICNVFLGEIAFLRMYKDFIHRYEEIDRVFLNVGTKRSFKYIFRGSENESLRTNPVIYYQALAINIVQRTPRYKLLLETMKKHTPPEHPEYADLLKGLSQIEDICSGINEYQRRKENEHKLFELQTKIDRRSLVSHNISQLVIPSRRLIRFGKVAIKINKTRRSLLLRKLEESLSFEAAEALMCSDKLIITRGRKNRVCKVLNVFNMEAEVKNNAIRCTDLQVDKIFELELTQYNTDKETRSLNYIASDEFSQNKMSIFLSTVEEAEDWANSIKKYSSLSSLQYVD